MEATSILVRLKLTSRKRPVIVDFKKKNTNKIDLINGSKSKDWEKNLQKMERMLFRTMIPLFFFQEKSTCPFCIQIVMI